MSIRGNLIGTTQKPEQVLLRSKSLTEEQKDKARNNIGAAPAGYGIGSASRKIEQDLNEATLGGIYYYNTQYEDPSTGEKLKTRNVPTDLGNGTVFVERYGTAEIFQHIQDVRGRMAERHGKLIGGVWIFDEPEYVNPPLFPGTEYRTTERFNGKAVYKKRDSNDRILYRIDGETEYRFGLVGAVPEGYSEGTFQVKSLDEINNVVTSEYSKMKIYSMKIITIQDNTGVPWFGGGVWFITLCKADYKWGFVQAYSYNDQGVRTLYNSMWNGKLAGWATPILYTEDGRWCTNCNTATKIGFYSLAGVDCINYPSKVTDMNYGRMRVERRINVITQEVQYDVYIARRHSLNAGITWSEWEYENPPMIHSVEYRTTERYNGKPVYAQAIDFGNLPNTNLDSKNMGARNVQYVIAYGGSSSHGKSLPHTVNEIITLNCYKSTESQIQFTISTDRDVSGLTATVWAKYTKTTD